MRIAIIASHGGSSILAVQKAMAETAHIRISTVISNNSKSLALERARTAGIRYAHISSLTHGSADAEDRAICAELIATETDLVLLSGYMKQIGANTLINFGGRIYNIHPSLLPKYGGKGFFGRRVHEAVIASGDRATGATLHLVTSNYDEGDTVRQQTIPVADRDTATTLETKVKDLEQNMIYRWLLEDF